MLSTREKTKMLNAIKKIYEVMEAQPISTPCADCNFYKPKKHQCEKFKNEVIPEEFRKNGCNQWVAFEDEPCPF